MKLTIIGRPGEGKSTLLTWLLRNLPMERFEARKINDNELSVKLVKRVLPSDGGMLMTDEALRRC